MAKFTSSAENAISVAADLAVRLSHNYVGTEHLLYGLCHSESGFSAKLLEENNVSAESVKGIIESKIGKGAEEVSINENSYTARTKGVLALAYSLDTQIGSEYAGTEHILFAIIRDSECMACRILRALGASPRELMETGYYFPR